MSTSCARKVTIASVVVIGLLSWKLYLGPARSRVDAHSTPASYAESHTTLQTLLNRNFSQRVKAPLPWRMAHATIVPGKIATPPPPLMSSPPWPQVVFQQSRSQHRCSQMQTRHHVVIGQTWGSLPVARQHEWAQLHCDVVLKSASRRDAIPVNPDQHTGGSHFLQRYKQQHLAALANRSNSSRLVRSASDRDRVVIAVSCSYRLAPSLTRGIVHKAHR